jgi:hypothetical protein
MTYLQGCLIYAAVVLVIVVLNYLTWRKPKPVPPTPKKVECYAEQQLREWEEQLVNAECQLAMQRFALIADDPDIDESVKDALFLVETKVVPILEEIV